MSRAEEVEVVSLIFPEVLVGVLPDGATTLRLPSPPVLIRVGINYPDHDPPEVAPPRQLRALQRWTPGQQILLEIVQELLASTDDGADLDGSAFGDKQTEAMLADSNRSGSAVPALNLAFVATPVVEVQRSMFQGFAANVASPDEARRAVRELAASTSKLARATHLSFAFRIPRTAATPLCDHDDDGEAGAGMRLAMVLERSNLAKGAVVVVARWFGGVMLGPQRFQFIMGAAKDALELLGKR